MKHKFQGSLGLYVILPLFFVSVAVSTTNFTMPATRHSGSVLTFLGHQARNMSKFEDRSLMEKLTPLEVSGKNLDYYENYKEYYYPYHPFLSPWIMAASYSLFGISEWSTRLPFLLLSLITIPLFWRVARKIVDDPTATLATIFFALCPMYAYHSVDSFHVIPQLFFILIGLLCYFRYLESGNRWNLLGIFGGQLGACWTDWTGYYFALVLVAHALFVHRRSWKIALSSVLFNFLIFGGFLLWLYMLEPENASAIKRLFDKGMARGSSAPLFPFLYGEAREIGIYFTVAMVLLSGLWIITRFKLHAPEDRTIACLLAFAADEVAFRDLAYKHDHYTFFLVLFFSLSAACGVRFLMKHISKPIWRGATFTTILLLFILQSAWFTYDRYTREGAWLYYRDLGIAVDKETQPDDRILILTEDNSMYTPFYGDRFALRYNKPYQILSYEIMGPLMENMTYERLLEFVPDHIKEFDVVVTAQTDRISKENAFFKGYRLDNPQHVTLMKKFGALPPGSKLELLVDKSTAHKTYRNGFTFHHIKD